MIREPGYIQVETSQKLKGQWGNYVQRAFLPFYQICQVDQAIFDLKWAEDSKINEKSMLSEYLSPFY